MCGLTGAVWTESRWRVSEAELTAMTDALAHRGPDGCGYFRAEQGSGGVALGHRRLSIIDLAQGAQPMSNEDGQVQVVFNGEIYNYRELIPDLQARGHRFRTSCDTEVLVHLYEEYGVEMLSHLRGMFAFALWDASRQSLLIARDRLGQKPLVYRQDSGRLLFASELKSLLQLDSVPREIDPQALDLYLTFQYVPHPHVIFRGFQKLPPAHAALWRDNKLEVFRYWEPPVGESITSAGQTAPPLTLAAAQTELRETLTQAVRLRLRSDVPLGAFLSGGIDSTIITGLMQQEAGRIVESFSIGFQQAEYDESAYARMAAQHLGTQHHEQIVRPSALEMLPKLAWHYDEPFADSSAIPTMVLCQWTRQSVKVALTGDGGDELFCGYDRYRAVRLGERFDRLPGFLRSLIQASCWQRLPSSVRSRSFSRRLKRFLGSLALDPRLRYLQWISQFQHQQRQDLYTPEFAAQVELDQAATWMNELYARFPHCDQVTQTTAVDLLSYLPCDILVKVDIASMAHGLECRSPFLDHRVAELAARLPLNLKLRGRNGKFLLCETFRDLIPEPILQRPKMGFGVPIDYWFRGELQPLLREYLLGDRALSRGYFRPEAVQRLIDEHTRKQQDHAYRLWSLLILEAWHRQHIDRTTLNPQP